MPRMTDEEVGEAAFRVSEFMEGVVNNAGDGLACMLAILESLHQRFLEEGRPQPAAILERTLAAFVTSLKETREKAARQ